MLFALRLCGQSNDPTESKILGWMMTGDTTIDVVAREAFNYLDTATTDSKTSFSKKFGRWYTFWQHRYDSSGNFNTAPQKMLDYVNQATTNELVCNANGDWRLEGPIKSAG